MRPEPNFPVRPDEFVGRRLQIDVFRQKTTVEAINKELRLKPERAEAS